MAEVNGVVTAVTWKKPEGGRYLLSGSYQSGNDIVEGRFWVNSAFAIEPGNAFTAVGDWESVTHPRSGREELHFKARQFRFDVPKTAALAERFLRVLFSDPKYGLTSESLRALVGQHGADTISVIADEPQHLSRLADNDEARLLVMARWNEKTGPHHAERLMSAVGWSADDIGLVIKSHGLNAYETLKQNPYVTARVPAIGFVKADDLGRHMGIPDMDNRRIDEAVYQTIRMQAALGYTCSPVSAIVQDLPKNVLPDTIDKTAFLTDYLTRADRNIGEYQVIIEQGEAICTTWRTLHGSSAVSRKIGKLMTDGRRPSYEAVSAICSRLFAEGGKFAHLDEVQQTAVRMAAFEPFSLVGGGPGVGKSTVMEAVVDVFEALGEQTVLLGAPFGKAAKRLSETTGRKAATAHRLLEAFVQPDGTTGFRRNAQNPLPENACIIIDETSTQDEAVFHALVTALPMSARIVFVGDPEQLPSVGPGAVLRDMILATSARGGIPMTYLKEVYRSGRDSGIATGAATIREGKIPSLRSTDTAGVSFQTMEQNQVTSAVVTMVLAARAEGLDPLRDIAVLCPQAKGPAGTWEINAALSEALNPGARTISGVFTSRKDDPKRPVPRIGDRVMLTENDRNQILMNGDLGVIVSDCRMPDGKPGYQVLYDDGERKDYPATGWRSHILAYAGTIHKYQGSQAHTVIMPIVEAHQSMLDRPIIYTGWTRAQKRLRLLGNKPLFERAVANGEKLRRETMLERLLPEHVLSLVQKTRLFNWLATSERAQASVEEKRRKEHPADQEVPQETSSSTDKAAPVRLTFSGKTSARAATPPVTAPRLTFRTEKKDDARVMTFRI